MRISKLKPQDEPYYNELAHLYGTIFNSLEWARIFDKTIVTYGIYDNNSNLVGGFFIYKENKYGLSICRNPQFTPTIGPFLKIDAKNPVSIMNKWKEIITLMADFLSMKRYSLVSVSLNVNVIDMQPFIWQKYKVIPGYTYLIDLKDDADIIWQNMFFKKRNAINRGVKDGLIVKHISDLEIVKKLVQKTFSRQKKICKFDILDKILFEFSKNNNSYAIATYRNDDPIAASFYVHNNHTVHQLLAGYDHENKHRGAEALVVWEAIKHAKILGLKTFDFEGSMIPEIETYFRDFGGQLTPYYTINKAKLPLEILLKFYKRELF